MAVTHDGNHHADEVMAMAILLIKFAGGIWIERTRDVSQFPTVDFMLDVGGKYDPEAGLFDHHQSDDPNLPKPTKLRPGGYATSGLVWREHGRDVVKRIYAERGVDDPSEEQVDKVFQIVDRSLMAPIDNWDTGSQSRDGVLPAQVVISVLKFSFAVNACMKILSGSVSKFVAEEIEVEQSEGEDAAKSWHMGPHIVLQARPGEMLSLSTAQRISKKRHDKGVLAVISHVKNNSQSVLRFNGAVRFTEKLRHHIEKNYPEVSTHKSGSLVFADDDDTLLQVARTAANNAKVYLRGA